jgi:hypothetical protein
MDVMMAVVWEASCLASVWKWTDFQVEHGQQLLQQLQPQPPQQLPQ